MMRLLLATTNPHKAAEFARLLRGIAVVAGCRPAGVWELVDLAEFPGVGELPETAESVGENARLKAGAAASHSGLWTLADDTGLFVEALDGRPGVRTARYGEPGWSASQRRSLLLEELESIPDSRRGAEFRCVVALAAPDGRIVAEGHGVCRGNLLRSPRGDRSFGFDSLFELPEYRRTLAELSPAASDVLTHRARATAKLLPALRGLP